MKTRDLLEVFTGGIRIARGVFINIYNSGGEYAEKGAEAKHNHVPDPSGQGSCILKERCLARIFLKRREKLIVVSGLEIGHDELDLVCRTSEKKSLCFKTSSEL